MIPARKGERERNIGDEIMDRVPPARAIELATRACAPTRNQTVASRLTGRCSRACVFVCVVCLFVFDLGIALSEPK